MKTYKSYKGKLKNYHTWASMSGAWTIYMVFNNQRIKSACSCLREVYKREEPCNNRTSIYAYHNCSNCLGYGIMPIPWTEVE